MCRHHASRALIRTLLAVLLVAACGARLARSEEEGASPFPELEPYVGDARPNIVMILPDQWVGHALAAFGDPNLRDIVTNASLTPHLDALAESGVVFRNCYATYPACRPNRSALLTGIYPHDLGSYDNFQSLSRVATGIAEVTRAAGYATGYIGKWHVNHGLERDELLPFGFVAPGGNRRHGFDYWAAYNAGHAYTASLYYGDDPVPIRPEPPDLYEPWVQTELARQFIHEFRNRPFHLVIAFGPPHDPRDEANVPAEYRARIHPEALLPRPNVPPFDDPEPWVQQPCPEEMGPEECWRTTMHGYYAQITSIDDMVGAIVGHLEEEGLLEDTIVVFTSDHGEMGGSHGHYDKGIPYRESLHVPWIVHWPSGTVLPPDARTHEGPVSSADIPVTLLGLIGEAFPGPVDGIDYSPWIRGEGPPPLRPHGGVLSEGRLTSDRSWRAIHSDDGWALWMRAGTREVDGLFDLTADPYQLENLAGTGNPMERPLTDRLVRLRWDARENVPFAEYPRDTYRDVDPLVWFGSNHVPLAWQGAMTRTGGIVRNYRLFLGEAIPGKGQAWDLVRDVYDATGTDLVDHEIHYGKTYFWKVVALDDMEGMQRSSRIFSFSTKMRGASPGLPDPALPGRPIEPSPHDGALGVRLATPLEWEGASSADSYIVRFGLDDPPPIVLAQLTTKYVPSLEPNTTYYWRVDAVNAKGTTDGDLWSFTTSDTLLLPAVADGALGVAAGTGGWDGVLPVRGGPHPQHSFVAFDLRGLPRGQRIVSATLHLLAGSDMHDATVHGWVSPARSPRPPLGPALDAHDDVVQGRRYGFEVTEAARRGDGAFRIGLGSSDDRPGLGWASRASRFAPVLEIRLARKPPRNGSG